MLRDDRSGRRRDRGADQPVARHEDEQEPELDDERRARDQRECATAAAHRDQPPRDREAADELAGAQDRERRHGERDRASEEDAHDRFSNRDQRDQRRGECECE